MTRYSEEDLSFFESLLEDKKSICLEQIENYQTQLDEITGNGKDENSIDNSGYDSQIEYLISNMGRSKRYYYELENALARIKHKTYGICVVTNQLIDRKRLIAVPTTTKSIIVKIEAKGK